MKYEDDIVLVGGSMEELQDIVNRAHEASSQAGLYLNTSKTKVMKTIRVPVWNEQDDILVNGHDIENVERFVYLEAMITKNYDDSKEIKRRIAIPNMQCLERQAISTTTKKRLWKSLAFNIPTYGSECWVLKTTDKTEINSFELWC